MNGNLPAKTQESTEKYFNNFFKNDLTVSQNVDDAVIGYFQSVTGDTESGKTLASSILYTALSQGIDPMEIIDEFRKLSPGELNAYLTVFLNINRINTSLLGLNNSPTVNKYIARAILP